MAPVRAATGDSEGASSYGFLVLLYEVLGVESCVRLRAGHVSEIVACGVPNDGRVEHVVDRAQPCPPSERRADGRDGSSALCLV